jgi:hypothetical protein
LTTEDDHDRAKRRTKVRKAILDGLDDKLLMGGSDKAAAELLTAYRLAREPTPLQWPWPQLTAYRLAYVRMRKAKSDQDLTDIDRLLCEAGDGKIALDPLQHALHIVVLQRLLELSKTQTENDALKERIERVFDQLLDSPIRCDAGSFERPVQDGHSNLVELLAFLIGRDYQRLEGLGSVRKTYFPESHDDGYVLVSNQGDDHHVRLTRHLAGGEFKDRIQRGSVDLAFTWHKNSDYPTMVHPEPKPLPNNRVSMLLPKICVKLKRVDAVNFVGSTNVFDDNLIIIRKRIAAMLGPIEECKLDHKEVIPLKKDSYSFHPKVRILGLVAFKHWSSLAGQPIAI